MSPQVFLENHSTELYLREKEGCIFICCTCGIYTPYTFCIYPGRLQDNGTYIQASPKCTKYLIKYFRLQINPLCSICNIYSFVHCVGQSDAVGGPSLCQ